MERMFFLGDIKSFGWRVAGGAGEGRAGFESGGEGAEGGCIHESITFETVGGRTSAIVLARQKKIYNSPGAVDRVERELSTVVDQDGSDTDAKQVKSQTASAPTMRPNTTKEKKPKKIKGGKTEKAIRERILG